MRVPALLLLLCCAVDLAAQAWPDTVSERVRAVWAELPVRLARIQPPNFPARTWTVRVGPDDDARRAIQHAIHACATAGGGRVVLPPGRYLSRGPIHLASKVDLHLAEGALLTFSQQPHHYLPLVKVRWEGTVAWNYSPFIYARGARNVALTGRGTIDGGARDWSLDWRARQDPDKDALRTMGAGGVPEDERRFGPGHYLRPTLVEFYDCENILVENLTLRGGAFWTLHPVFSRNVTLRGLDIRGGTMNDDGIDPDSCEDVLIENCSITTHDDAISVKSGRDQDAWQRPGSRNIIVRNCTLSSGVNALCVGSEMSGGVSELFIEQCTIVRARHGLTLKANLDRGGYARNIYVRNLRADSLLETLLTVRTDYHGYRGGNSPPDFRRLFLERVEVDHVGGAVFSLTGAARARVRGVYADSVRIDKATELGTARLTEDVYLQRIWINRARIAGGLAR